MSTKVTSPSNPSVTSTNDSWESRIKSAATFMGLSAQQVEEGLKKLGVEKEPAGLEMLSDESITPFGDIRAIFCDRISTIASIPETGGFIIPIAKVRLAMKYLRGSQNSPKADTLDPEMAALQKKYGFKMKLEDVDPSELLENYHPEQPNHPVTMVLKKKFGDSKIIVFKPESTIVDIEATANYIADLAQGFDEQETVESDGLLVRIYEVGKIPDQMIEEDPLFEGKPLKRGRSIINRVNWTDIGMPVRQFCRVIVDRGDIDENDRFHVQELMKQASKGTIELRKAYPEADLTYRELVKKNELPKLIMTMESASGKKQNPFNIKNNRQF